MPVAATYSAGIVGWRIYTGTIEGPLPYEYEYLVVVVIVVVVVVVVGVVVVVFTLTHAQNRDSVQRGHRTSNTQGEKSILLSNQILRVRKQPDRHHII